MAEYIDKQAFLDYMRGTNRYFTVKCDIESFSTVDVVPVVHGRWISKNHHGYEWVFVCSNCGYIDGYPFNDRSNYCPNCGAKMDGGIEKWLNISIEK